MPTWPLTGRDEELRLIARSLAGGETRGIVLYGDAGVGKTRLARDAVLQAADHGAVTRWAIGTATSAEIPLGASAHLVPRPQSGPMPSPFVLLRQAADRLVADAGGQPLVVGVDDAHLLDPLSATLVQQLALTGAARLVLTIRTGERVPDILVSLWKDELLDRLEVHPLGREGTSQLVEAMLGGTVESVSLSHLWDVTRGNPLFVRHLVEGELEGGRLLEVSGVWQWRGTMAAGSALTELVEVRLSELEASARALLEHLALGEPLGIGVLAELAGSGALPALEERGLVTTVADARRLEARLAHPLYGEVLRSRIGPLRARMIKAALADAIDRHGMRRKGDALKVAVLRVDSGGTVDPRLMSEATALAFALLDMALAERLGRAAVAAGGGLQPALLVSIATSFQGRPEEANEELERMAVLAQNDEERAVVTVPLVANLFWSLGRPREAEQALEQAERRVTPRGRASLELRGVRAAMAYHLGRPREAIKTSADVLGSAEASPSAQAWAAAAAACAWARIGAADRAAEMAALGTEALRRAPQASMLEGALVWGGVTGDMLAGRLDRANEKARLCHARALERSHRATPIGALTMGVVALSRGALVTARRWFGEVVAAAAEQDAAGWGWLGHIYLTHALGMAGNAEGACKALDASAAACHPSLVVHGADDLLARAWVAAAEGVIGDACARARAAAELASAQGLAAVELHAWHTLVRVGGFAEAVEAVPHLDALAGVVQGPWASIVRGHAQGRSDDDGGALDRIGSAFEDLGAALLAADAFAHATAAHREAGRRSRANASGQRVRALVELCEGARTPAIAAAEPPLPISTREREVALLAARGLSNRQIAERLVLSVRTVESHLYQASAKLGVDGRDRLVDALGPLADGDGKPGSRSAGGGAHSG